MAPGDIVGEKADGPGLRPSSYNAGRRSGRWHASGLMGEGTMTKEEDRSRVMPEVEAALAEGRGGVALESTLIAQGLPWPRNLEAARLAEAEVRRAGGVPATIAILEGTIRVGLSGDELERIAAAPSGHFLKASRRDLAMAVARGLDA